MRIGVPWWHFSAEDFFADAARPGASVFVAQERHRRGLARTVTFGAVLEEDRRHLFVESDVGLRLREAVGAARGAHEEGGGQDGYCGAGCKKRFFHDRNLA